MEILNLKTVYSTPFNCPNYNSIKAKDCSVGDNVYVLVSRLSSSNWLQNTNKNHGWVIVRGKVILDKDTDGKSIEYNQEDISNWTKPIGKERETQAVAQTYPNCIFDYVVQTEMGNKKYPCKLKFSKEAKELNESGILAHLGQE